MTQQEEANRLRMSKRPVSMETRRFAAIRLAATTSSLSQELSRMVKNAREENSRRGGWVRIFPTAETWPLYGSMLEFSSPNNQILHEHLFPEAAKRHLIRPPVFRPKPKPPAQNQGQNVKAANPNNPSTVDYRKRSQSAGPGRERSNSSIDGDRSSKKSSVDEGCESGEPESMASDLISMAIRPMTSSGAITASSSTSSGIGSMASSEDDVDPVAPSSPPVPVRKC